VKVRSELFNTLNPQAAMRNRKAHQSSPMQDLPR